MGIKVKTTSLNLLQWIPEERLTPKNYQILPTTQVSKSQAQMLQIHSLQLGANCQYPMPSSNQEKMWKPHNQDRASKESKYGVKFTVKVITALRFGDAKEMEPGSYLIYKVTISRIWTSSSISWYSHAFSMQYGWSMLFGLYGIDSVDNQFINLPFKA